MTRTRTSAPTTRSIARSKPPMPRSSGGAPAIPAQIARIRKSIDRKVEGWHRTFIALWEARLKAVGIDLDDPRFKEREAKARAEGRWPEPPPNMFGLD